MQLYVVVTLKGNPNIALAQVTLRNAGFDQKLAKFSSDVYAFEGTIDSHQMKNLEALSQVESVEQLREVT